MAAAYRNGVGIADLADEYELTPGTVRLILKRHGCELTDGRNLRKGNTPPTPKTPRLPDEAIQERNRQMVEQRWQGVTLDAIATRHGVTRERVRQIILKAGGPTRKDLAKIAAEKAEKQRAEHLTALRADLSENPDQYVGDLAKRYGLKNLEVKDVAHQMGVLPLLKLGPERSTDPVFSDEDFAVSIQQAAIDLAAETIGPAEYDTWRRQHPETPSSQTMFARGMWRRACKEAGVTPRPSIRPEYGRISVEDCLRDVARWLDSNPRSVSSDSYRMWAHENGAVSLSIAYRRIGGSWADVRRAAYQYRSQAA